MHVARTTKLAGVRSGQVRSGQVRSGQVVAWKSATCPLIHSDTDMGGRPVTCSTVYQVRAPFLPGSKVTKDGHLQLGAVGVSGMLKE